MMETQNSFTKSLYTVFMIAMILQAGVALYDRFKLQADDKH